MKKLLWILWLVLALAVGGYYSYQLLVDDQKDEFLIGETSYGHYQIELSCSSCHTDSFGGKDALQKACEGCHAAELEEAHDSHPRKKFTDPREAYRIEILDGRYCVSCHTEHQREKTHAMGLTLPEDYCFHCHQDVVEERPSHKGLSFDSCASAGCHNFHDNRALYESFLIRNANQPWLLSVAKIGLPNDAAGNAKVDIPANTQPLPPTMKNSNVHQDYAGTEHAKAGVTCGGCHQQGGKSAAELSADQSNTVAWMDKPGVEQCAACHTTEAEGFKQGKHGMRLNSELAQSLGAISPVESPLEFKKNTQNLHQGCNNCHSAHQFETKLAAVESCLACHDDSHSLAFEQSPHKKLWDSELAGNIPTGSGVSCATCHMPRVTYTKNGTEFVRVEHNQNKNLRPNEKMIRSVCMNCHSLEFSIDALADRALIESNFSSKPNHHIPSIDWALEREQ